MRRKPLRTAIPERCRMSRTKRRTVPSPTGRCRRWGRVRSVIPCTTAASRAQRRRVRPSACRDQQSFPGGMSAPRSVGPLAIGRQATRRDGSVVGWSGGGNNPIATGTRPPTQAPRARPPTPRALDDAKPAADKYRADRARRRGQQPVDPRSSPGGSVRGGRRAGGAIDREVPGEAAQQCRVAGIEFPVLACSNMTCACN